MARIQAQIKGVHNGNLTLEIPLRMLRRILDLQAPNEAKQVDDAWKKAQGILKNSKVDPVKYQRKLRDEWS